MNLNKTVGFHTLGCKVNQYDTQLMKELLVENGYTVVSEELHPDIFIINSCSVTGKSDRKSRQMVSKFRTKLPHSIIVLTGCMPQTFPAEAAALEKADIILSNASNDTLLKAIEEFQKTNHKIVQINTHKKENVSQKITNFEDRTKAYLKIEDGCNRFCSYCIIPFARGRVRSKPLAEIENEINALATKGYKEIVLIGINLTAYGTDIGCNLADAVETACRIEKIERVRLGSIEPDQLNEQMIERLALEPKLCPSFHLSLQSGCDKTLAQMNRNYDTNFYGNLVNTLRNKFKNASITTDIMVGFPGETEEDFNNSLAFAKKIAFSKAHIFTYSKRKGTKAAEMSGQIEGTISTIRKKKMIELAEKTQQAFLETQLHKTYPVLFEISTKKNLYEGYTPNYTHVKVKTNTNLTGKIIDVYLNEIEKESCIGIIK